MIWMVVASRADGCSWIVGGRGGVDTNEDEDILNAGMDLATTSGMMCSHRRRTDSRSRRPIFEDKDGDRDEEDGGISDPLFRDSPPRADTVPCSEEERRGRSAGRRKFKYVEKMMRRPLLTFQVVRAPPVTKNMSVVRSSHLLLLWRRRIAIRRGLLLRWRTAIRRTTLSTRNRNRR